MWRVPTKQCQSCEEHGAVRTLDASLIACWPFDVRARDESQGPWASSARPLGTTVNVAHLKMSTFSEHSLPSKICSQATGVSSESSFQAEEVELDEEPSPNGTSLAIWGDTSGAAHAKVPTQPERVLMYSLLRIFASPTSVSLAVKSLASKMLALFRSAQHTASLLVQASSATTTQRQRRDMHGSKACQAIDGQQWPTKVHDAAAV